MVICGRPRSVARDGHGSGRRQKGRRSGADPIGANHVADPDQMLTTRGYTRLRAARQGRDSAISNPRHASMHAACHRNQPYLCTLKSQRMPGNSAPAGRLRPRPCRRPLNRAACRKVLRRVARAKRDATLGPATADGDQTRRGRYHGPCPPAPSGTRRNVVAKGHPCTDPQLSGVTRSWQGSPRTARVRAAAGRRAAWSRSRRPHGSASPSPWRNAASI